MAHYFMHLRNHVDELLDPEGREFENIDGLKKAVAVLSRLVQDGGLLLVFSSTMSALLQYIVVVL